MKQTFNNIVVVSSVTLGVHRLGIQPDTGLSRINNCADTFSHACLRRPILLTVRIAAGWANAVVASVRGIITITCLLHQVRQLLLTTLCKSLLMSLLLLIYGILNPDLISKHHLLLSIQSLVIHILSLVYDLILEERLSHARFRCNWYERLGVHLQTKLVLIESIKVVLLI